MRGPGDPVPCPSIHSPNTVPPMNGHSQQCRPRGELASHRDACSHDKRAPLYLGGHGGQESVSDVGSWLLTGKSLSVTSYVLSPPKSDNSMHMGRQGGGRRDARRVREVWTGRDASCVSRPHPNPSAPEVREPRRRIWALKAACLLPTTL